LRKSNKKPLQEKLAALTEAEKRRLYRLAAKKRKASMLTSRTNRAGLKQKLRQPIADQDDTIFEKRTRRTPVSLDDWVLKLLAEEEEKISQISLDPDTVNRRGMVISVQAAQCTVRCEKEYYPCNLRPELTMTQRSDLTVGDEVAFSTAQDGTHIVENVFDRRSTLSRPDPYDPRIEKVIAANIEIAVVVVSIMNPPLSTSLIDRFLMAIERGNVTPLICVNKTDLLDTVDGETAKLAEMEIYKKLGVSVVHCSALTGTGINDLADKLSDKLCVLVGHSGVGKSSLLNAIQPDLNLLTRGIRENVKKGRHTTTGSTLYNLPQDIRIIDTPGIRSFGLWKVTPEELRWYFQEFEDYIGQCKFSNCTHSHEPDCAIKQATAEKNIQPIRYESYLRILASLSEPS